MLELFCFGLGNKAKHLSLRENLCYNKLIWLSNPLKFCAIILFVHNRRYSRKSESCVLQTLISIIARMNSHFHNEIIVCVYVMTRMWKLEKVKVNI